jgi:PmbA protein
MTRPRAIEKSLDRLADIATRSLEQLRGLGVDHAEVAVGTGNELEVSVRQGEVELVKEAGSSGLSVRVVHDGRVATSSTTDFRPESLAVFLARAVEMAQLGEPDPLAVPPSPRELVRRWPELELFDRATDKIGAARAIKLATAGERAALRADARITASEGASFGRSSGCSVLATSGGFVGRSAGTYQSLVVQAVADDEGGKKRKGVHWTGGRFFADLEPAADIGKEAARRAVAQLGAVKIPTGKYPVVFENNAARAIIGLVASCVLGDAVYRDRSYLKGRIGTAIASPLVTLVDDPLMPRAPGSRAYDGEGRRVGKIAVCKKGVLGSYLLDTYSARKLGLSPTGSASGGGGVPHSSTSNFYLVPGRAEPESLLRGIERGLFVTRMMGFGFDPTTGNFSRGAEGFLIENGELGRPVSEVTVSRNLDELLRGIDKIANDLELKTSIAAPSFRVDEMTVAGA